MWFFGYTGPFDRTPLSVWASWISCELQQHDNRAQNPPLESYTNLSNSTWPGHHLKIFIQHMQCKYNVLIHFATVHVRWIAILMGLCVDGNLFISEVHGCML